MKRAMFPSCTWNTQNNFYSIRHHVRGCGITYLKGPKRMSNKYPIFAENLGGLKELSGKSKEMNLVKMIKR